MENAFELIEYNGIPYPEGYISKIKEIAGHLDKEEIETEDSYSLHTEYSYRKRNLGSLILMKYADTIGSVLSFIITCQIDYLVL